MKPSFGRRRQRKQSNPWRGEREKDQQAGKLFSTRKQEDRERNGSRGLFRSKYPTYEECRLAICCTDDPTATVSRAGCIYGRGGGCSVENTADKVNDDAVAPYR